MTKKASRKEVANKGQGAQEQRMRIRSKMNMSEKKYLLKKRRSLAQMELLPRAGIPTRTTTSFSSTPWRKVESLTKTLQTIVNNANTNIDIAEY